MVFEVIVGYTAEVVAGLVAISCAKYTCFEAIAMPVVVDNISGDFARASRSWK